MIMTSSVFKSLYIKDTISVRNGNDITMCWVTDGDITYLQKLADSGQFIWLLFITGRVGQANEVFSIQRVTLMEVSTIKKSRTSYMYSQLGTTIFLSQRQLNSTWLLIVSDVDNVTQTWCRAMQMCRRVVSQTAGHPTSDTATFRILHFTNSQLPCIASQFVIYWTARHATLSVIFGMMRNESGKWGVIIKCTSMEVNDEVCLTWFRNNPIIPAICKLLQEAFHRLGLLIYSKYFVSSTTITIPSTWAQLEIAGQV